LTSSGLSISNISYEAFGGLSSEKYVNSGNSSYDFIHAIQYNSRLQPSEIKLGTSGTSDSVFKLSYIYGTVSSPNDADGSIDATQNNGNVGRIKYTIGGTLQYSQTYQYDALNRLTYGVEHNNGTLNDSNRAWYQTFTYDRWGNRAMTAGSTSSNLNQGGTPLGSSDFSSSTNRISKTGYSYDNAGNLTNEPSSKTYEYDGENKMKKATVSGADNYYWYDADGRRVKKVVGTTSATRFVYNLAGQLAAEYTDAGSLLKEYVYKGGVLVATIEPTGGVKYATADHLGTPRVWTDSSGNVMTGGRHDYAPFGEELFAGFGVRTTGQNWPATAQADGQRDQFTGYERDVETGLDYAEERYCSSLQGRFTSSDPLMASGRSWNPQSWNRYSYVLNRPISLIDPTGMREEYSIEDNSTGDDPQSGRKKEEQQQTITVQTYGDVPEILSAKSKQLGSKQGEVPVGGRFEVEYKYQINNPESVGDANKNPGSYGKLEPLNDGKTLEGQSSPISLLKSDVKSQRKGDILEVTKIDTYEVTSTAHSVINYQIVVSDPLVPRVDRLPSSQSQNPRARENKFIYVGSDGKERERVRERPLSIYVDSKRR